MDSIILIGFMGSGKSSVGTLLAKELRFRFIDTDREIEKENHRKISKIFDESGEEYFRNLETGYIRNLIPLRQPSVISTGGGLPLRECNAGLLREIGMVVYLKAEKDTIINRVKKDKNRPLLRAGDLEKQVEDLLRLRELHYKECAHIEISTDNLSLSDIVSEIINKYKRWDAAGRITS